MAAVDGPMDQVMTGPSSMSLPKSASTADAAASAGLGVCYEKVEKRFGSLVALRSTLHPVNSSPCSATTAPARPRFSASPLP
jgi:hypothetical protein